MFATTVTTAGVTTVVESVTVVFVVDAEKVLSLDDAKVDSPVHFAGTSSMTVVAEPGLLVSPLTPGSGIFVFVCSVVLLTFIFCGQSTCATAIRFCSVFGGAVAVKVFADVRGRFNKALKRLARTDADSNNFFWGGAGNTFGTFIFSEDLQFSTFDLVIKACAIVNVWL